MSQQTTPALNCTFDGDTVRCRDDKSGVDRTIPVEDILGVVPNNGERANEATMLFLHQQPNSPGSPPKAERIRINIAFSTLLSSDLLMKVPGHLCQLNTEDLRVHIVISTASGTGTAEALFTHTLQPVLSWVGLDRYQVHETQSAQSITDLCHVLFIPQAEAGVQQTIILLSGDGGLCDVVDSFHGTSRAIYTMPNIALVPTGTGNAMASSTGLMACQKAALMALLRGRPVPLPTFCASFSHGARYDHNSHDQVFDAGEFNALRIHGSVVASWGIHAALVADSDTVQYRKFGADRFKMAAEELLFPTDGSETHKYKGAITLMKRTDDDEIESEEVLGHREHMYVLATMVSNLEREFKISPQSAPMDGSLRVIRFGPMSPQRAMQLLSAAYQNGQHVQDEDVMYREIEGFKIDFHELDERWRRVCIDGRMVVVEQDGWIEVRKVQKRFLNLLLEGI